MTTEITHIEALSPGLEPLWDEYVRKHSEGSFYHQLWWRDLFRNLFRHEPHYLIARNGVKIVGVMPLFKTPTLRGALMSSIPFRDRAAPLTDDSEVLERLLCRAVEISRESGCKTLLVKSPSPLKLEGDFAPMFSHASDWVRSIVTLPASQPAYWRKINDKTRNMIRQAESAGLEFSLVTHDVEAVDEAIDVLKQTQHRLGLPPFPKSYYMNLVGILAQKGLGEVYVVKFRGCVVAAAILFFEKNNAVYAYAGSLPKAWPLRANDFLVWHALGAAIDEGKTFFDFGSDSIRQENLLFFKRKWGAEHWPLHYYSHIVGAAKGCAYVWRDSSQGFYPLLRRGVRLMPHPIYELTGFLTRYFA